MYKTGTVVVAALLSLVVALSLTGCPQPAGQTVAVDTPPDADVSTPAREGEPFRIGALFKNFEPAILAVFFTLAGMNLEFEHAHASGLVAVIYFVMFLAC